MRVNDKLSGESDEQQKTGDIYVGIEVLKGQK